MLETSNIKQPIWAVHFQLTLDLKIPTDLVLNQYSTCNLKICWLKLVFFGWNFVKGVKIQSLEHLRSTSKNKTSKSVKIFIKLKTGFWKINGQGWSPGTGMVNFVEFRGGQPNDNWPKSEWFFVLWVNKIVNILFRESIEFGCSLNNIQIILNQLELFHAQTP